jgi:hypothetical protein
MKRFAMALALVCALSTSIFAGNMPTDGKTQEPPPPTASTTSTSTASTLLSVVVTLITLR